MRLEQEYLKILDRSFATQFPGWETMSPLDPVKLLAEGLVHSFAAIEIRQKRLVETLLNSLPTLFGFESKQSEAPIALFRFQSSAKLQASETIPASLYLRFQAGKEAFHLSPLRTFELLPLTRFRAEGSKNKVTFSFQTTGPCAVVPLYFLPQPQVAAVETVTILSAQAKVTPKSGVARTFETDSLKVCWKNEGQFSQLTIAAGQDGRAPLTEGFSEVEITIEFSETLDGSWETNVAPCHVFRLCENLPLGRLKGLAWEEIDLKPQILEAPSEVDVHFPDDRTERLYRLDSDVLKIRHANPDRFSRCFLYNGINHSIIIPNGDGLVGNYGGAVQLVANNIKQHPEMNWQDPSYKSQLGSLAMQLESVIAVRELSCGSERETEADYLARFYTTLRSFSSEPRRQSSFSPRDISSSLITDVARVKRVETQSDNKSISVYVLANRPNPSQSLALACEEKDQIEHRLERILPLDYRYTLLPFCRRDIGVTLRLDTTLSESRLGTITRELITARVNELLFELMLPPPFGKLEHNVMINKARLISKLSESLCVPARDGTQLLPSEIETLEMWICDGPERVYVDELVRAPGDIFYPTVEAQVTIRSVDAATLVNEGRRHG